MSYVYRPLTDALSKSITWKRRNWTLDSTTRKRLPAAPTALGTVTCGFEPMSAQMRALHAGRADQIMAIAKLPSDSGVTLTSDCFAELSHQGQARELDIVLIDPYDPHTEIHLVEQVRGSATGGAGTGSAG